MAIVRDLAELSRADFRTAINADVGVWVGSAPDVDLEEMLLIATPPARLMIGLEQRRRYQLEAEE